MASLNGPMPPNSSQMTTLLGLTVGNLTPYQVDQLVAALATRKNYRLSDSLTGTGESNMTTIFSGYPG